MKTRLTLVLQKSGLEKQTNMKEVSILAWLKESVSETQKYRGLVHGEQNIDR